jgi:hypothetical protein
VDWLLVLQPREQFDEIKSVQVSLGHRAQLSTFEKMKTECNITGEVVGA